MDVMSVVREIDVYAGAVVDCEPVGTVAIPVRLLVQLHKALVRFDSEPPVLGSFPGIDMSSNGRERYPREQMYREGRVR